MIKRTLLSTLVSSALALTATAAQAQISDGVIKIGVMNDMSGLYADITGPGSVIAARMAVEDFGAEKKGMKVEIVSADHQNKPDIGSSIARSGSTPTRSMRSSTCRPRRWRWRSTRSPAKRAR
jgi:branched-chain amino acid transport system substrate-binding protein